MPHACCFAGSDCEHNDLGNESKTPKPSFLPSDSLTCIKGVPVQARLSLPAAETRDGAGLAEVQSRTTLPVAAAWPPHHRVVMRMHAHKMLTKCSCALMKQSVCRTGASSDRACTHSQSSHGMTWTHDEFAMRRSSGSRPGSWGWRAWRCSSSCRSCSGAGSGTPAPGTPTASLAALVRPPGGVGRMAPTSRRSLRGPH